MIKNMYPNLMNMLACEWTLLALCSSVLVFRKQYIKAFDSACQMYRFFAKSLLTVTIFAVNAIGIFANYLGLEGTYYISRWCITHFLPLLFFILFNLAAFLLAKIVSFFDHVVLVRRRISDGEEKIVHSLKDSAESISFPTAHIVLLQ